MSWSSIHAMTLTDPPQAAADLNVYTEHTIQLLGPPQSGAPTRRNRGSRLSRSKRSIYFSGSSAIVDARLYDIENRLVINFNAVKIFREIL